MLFNSYEYIFLFLPAAAAVYFLLGRAGGQRAARAWLVVCSLFFYAWGEMRFIPVLMGSVLLNYAMGRQMSARIRDGRGATGLLVLGVGLNVAALAFFKYAGFILDNIGAITGASIAHTPVGLPLGISFFTFQQIAYLVDVKRGRAGGEDFLGYAVFVCFFPRLLAGPIVRAAELMPQIMAARVAPDWTNISRGLYIFMLGLFKKVAIADHLSQYVGRAFDSAATLSLLEAWGASLSYTFQLYFDFSGYTDMAIGAALLFNLALPANFDSPYKSLDIREFWRRWHVTLGTFLRDYIYFPLGGSHGGQARTLANLMITFLLCGLWHGAGWTFVLWGAAHGAAMCINRLWMGTGLRMGRTLAWLVTFNFVNLSWVLFRARDFSSAAKVYAGMFGMSGVELSEKSRWMLGFAEGWGAHFTTRSLGSSYLNLCLALLLLTLMTRNTNEMAASLEFRLRSAAFAALLGAYAILNMGGLREFLYFNF